LAPGSNSAFLNFSTLQFSFTARCGKSSKPTCDSAWISMEARRGRANQSRELNLLERAHAPSPMGDGDRAPGFQIHG